MRYLFNVMHVRLGVQQLCKVDAKSRADDSTQVVGQVGGQHNLETWQQLSSTAQQANCHVHHITSKELRASNKDEAKRDREAKTVEDLLHRGVGGRKLGIQATSACHAHGTSESHVNYIIPRIADRLGYADRDCKGHHTHYRDTIQAIRRHAGQEKGKRM